MNCFKLLCYPLYLRNFLKKRVFHTAPNPIRVFNLDFKNPVGLGAGFDKNAQYLQEMEILGFGFIEIGTVTPLPQKGNKKPRLFRLPEDKALINRMGFNNDGVEIVTERLRKWRTKTAGAQTLVVGGNIGKNKDTPNGEAYKDYEICLRSLHPYVDFFVVNVSSPNTPGLRQLQEKEALKKILTHLQSVNLKIGKGKPILLKIAPDLTESQVEDVVELALEIKLSGLVAANTTIDHSNLKISSNALKGIGQGGLSGKPLEKRSTQLINSLHLKSKGLIPLIASGGIFTMQDAEEKFVAGASLIEVWTGFIYEGPSIVSKICRAKAKKDI
ncbi:MAG: quinone-dependent dihydroorotate dehydrogenase [Flavisolibacter sp.]